MTSDLFECREGKYQRPDRPTDDLTLETPTLHDGDTVRGAVRTVSSYCMIGKVAESSECPGVQMTR
jgi:hypothetical protein